MKSAIQKSAVQTAIATVFVPLFDVDGMKKLNEPLFITFDSGGYKSMLVKKALRHDDGAHDDTAYKDTLAFLQSETKKDHGHQQSMSVFAIGDDGENYQVVKQNGNDTVAFLVSYMFVTEKSVARKADIAHIKISHDKAPVGITWYDSKS